MKRKTFVKALPFMISGTQAFLNELAAMPATELTPAFFIGHGSPMNAITDNPFTKDINTAAQLLTKPQAIMVVSAHWLTNGTFVSTNKFPKTIYDFGGFPEALSKVKYEPSGSIEYALKVKELLTLSHVKNDDYMGLDHGAWSILKHMYPKADVPVFQLSIDANKPAAYHYDLIKQLASLRRKGLMIIGSGNIVHNLGRLNWATPNASPYDWALEFDAYVKQYLDTGNHAALVNYLQAGTAAKMAVPTNEHYLPLLYVLSVQEKNEAVQYIHHSFDMGSISMRSFMLKQVNH